MDAGEAARLIFALASLAIAEHAFGGHAFNWTIVNEKELIEGSQRARVFRDVECCTGLRAPLPRIAKTAGEPCPSDPSRICLGNGWPLSGWYDAGHRTVVLPIGNDEALRHEFIHALRHYAFGDYASHEGPEWACQ